MIIVLMLLWHWYTYIYIHSYGVDLRLLFFFRFYCHTLVCTECAVHLVHSYRVGYIVRELFIYFGRFVIISLPWAHRRDIISSWDGQALKSHRHQWVKPKHYERKEYQSLVTAIDDMCIAIGKMRMRCCSSCTHVRCRDRRRGVLPNRQWKGSIQSIVEPVSGQRRGIWNHGLPLNQGLYFVLNDKCHLHTTCYYCPHRGSMSA